MTTQSLFSLWSFNCGTNTAPVVTDEWVSVRSGKTFATSASVLLSNDKDANGDTLSISACGKPAHGTLSVNCGNLSYCPAAGFVGTDTFTYTVSDGHGGKTTATVHITVLPPAQPPAITGALDDAGTQTGNVVTGGSTDDLRPTLSGTAEAGAKVVVYDGSTKLGTVTADANGRWSLTPATDLAQGAHHFSASATGTDGTHLGTSSAYDLSCVIDTNHPPVVVGEAASVRAGSSFVTSVAALLANDSDPDGNPLSITSLGTPTHGSLVRAADGSITYTPQAGYTGGDSYTYVVSDGKGGTATGTVQITVKAAMLAPVITDVVDDAGTQTGTVANGGSTDDSLPLLHGTAEAGAGVDVLAGGVTIGHVVADASGLWSFQVTTALGQGPQQFSAQATAADGATAASAGYDIILAADPVPDTHADAPTVSIRTDANDDGRINRAELGTATTATVRLGLPADAQAGDVVSLTDGSQPQTHTLTDADIAAGHWNATVALPAEGATLKVSATITDGLGNVSVPGTDAAVLDTEVATPEVTILADVNNDGYVNANELGGAATLAVKVAFPSAQVNVGDVLHFSANGVPQAITLGLADQAAGHILVNVPVPAEGGSLSVVASIVDTAGNVSPPAADQALLDTTGPAAPTVAITTDANDDGHLASGEMVGVTAVAFRVGLPAGAQLGETLSVTGSTGTLSHVLTQADLDAGAWAATLPAPAAGASFSVSVTRTDLAGNVSAAASDSAVRDAAEPSSLAVTLLADANNNGFLTAAELNAATVLTVRITVPTGAQPGDTLTLQPGTLQQQTHQITADDLSRGHWDALFARPAEGGTLKVVATWTDGSGSTSAPVQDSAVVDTRGPSAPGIEITTDADNDGLLTPTEQGGSPTDQIKVTLPVDARVGDVLHIETGGVPIHLSLTVAMVEAGLLYFDVAKPANGGTLTVTATLSDPAGNVSPAGIDSAVLMVLDLPAPGVRIANDLSNDGYLNATERGSAALADLVITLPAGALAGQLLTVRDAAGHVLTHTVSAAEQAAAEVSLPAAFALPVEGATLKVSATLTDAFGNVSAAGTDAVTLDTRAASAPGVEIVTDANNDGVLSRTEQGTSPTDSVKVTLPGDARVGDTLRIETGGTPIVRVLSVADVEGGQLFFDLAKPANGSTLTVTATLTDAAGNVSAPGYDAAMLLADDLPAPTVHIVTDANNDGVINAAERGAAMQADLRVTLPAGAMLGQTLTVTDSAGHPITHVLVAADLAAGTVSFPAAYPLPVEGAKLTVTAQLSDNYGNSSPVATDSASLDSVASAAATVTITTDANNDGSISATEIGNATTVAIQVALAAGVAVGDTITLGGNVAAQTHVVTAADLAAGAWDTTVARPANGSTINATATLTDAADNVSQPGSDSATLATVVCKASLVGDCGIYEGCAGTYKVQLDQAVAQDTTFYVQAQNGTATWVDHAAANQNILWGGFYNTYSWTGWCWKESLIKVAAIGGDIPSAGKSYGADGTTTWDYSLNGGSASNLVAVTVHAGQTCSDSFTVNAWNETVSRDGDLNNTGYVEGTETFTLHITGSSNAAGVTYGTPSLAVNIFDTTCYKLFSPIAIDLNGDGVKTTAIGETAGSFDLLGNGAPVVSGWLSGQDGFLAVDANHNGQIDSVNELFGGANGEAMTKLAQYDSNGDGVVDKRDAQFQDLLVWQDANGDKLTQAGELISLTDAGIARLSTLFMDSGAVDVAGNVHQAVGSVTFADGHAADMTDVYFNYAESDAALAASDVLATAHTTIDLGALAAPAAAAVPMALAAPVDLAALDLHLRTHLKVQLLEPHCTQAA